MEEGGPVDVVCELPQRLGFDSASPRKFRNGWVVVFPVYRDLISAGLFDGESCLLFASVKLLSSFLMVFLIGVDENLAIFGQKGGCDRDRPRSVEDVNKWTCVMFCDFDGGVGGAGRGSADKDWNIFISEASFFGLLGDGDHFVERRGNEPGKADDVGVVFFNCI